MDGAGWCSAVAVMDGRTIVVSGGADKTVRVWDAATGAPVGDPYTGHIDEVWSAAVGQMDGRTIVVSGGADKTLGVVGAPWVLGCKRP
ncbi:WD40 repeat domain-containing protein [Phytohabitans rumicis]|uniref:Uncharacterized protein n=1 Tax=Phytohabitans rumicis TaxID=1076125 RepID=A0A6V8KYP0_9ACTN|nr:hypothetical protein [Phytohabitans rumicis]GFJ87561.1 hypothetical protein Prum_012030 [Phytohabitans rumicis]